MLLDQTGHLLLTAGQIMSSFKPSGSTFRTNEGMGHYGMSCQYWQPPRLKYMHPGLNRYLTGVGSWWWKDSYVCGQCLEIRRFSKNVVVVVGDYCPECTPMQLDLIDIASRKLSFHNKPENYDDIKVRKVSCDWPHKRQYYLDKGSSVYNWYIIPLFLERPLISLRAMNHSGYHDKYGRWVVAFKTLFPSSKVKIYACDDLHCFVDSIYFNPRDEL